MSIFAISVNLKNERARTGQKMPTEVPLLLLRMESTGVLNGKTFVPIADKFFMHPSKKFATCITKKMNVCADISEKTTIPKEKHVCSDACAKNLSNVLIRRGWHEVTEFREALTEIVNQFEDLSLHYKRYNRAFYNRNKDLERAIAKAKEVLNG